MKSSRCLTILFLLVSCFLLAPEATAQKSGTKYRPFPAYGFKFKPLKDWSDVPVDDGDRAGGLIAQLSGEKPVRIKTPDNRQMLFSSELRVLKVDPPKASTEEESSGGGGLRGRVNKKAPKEKSGKDFVAQLFGGALRMDEFKLLETEIETFKVSSSLIGEYEKITTYIVTSGGGLDANFHVYTFQLPDYKIVFIWMVPSLGAKKDKKWDKAVEKSMKTLRVELKDIETTNIRNVNSDSDYEDLLEFHRNDVAQTPGWQLIETPSKQYLIKTNSDNKKRIKEVIKRLEASRRLFEEDFPPKSPITQISVVRVCNTRDEFQTFSGAGGGVAGYFRPSTEELVLFFDPESKDSTLSVMTHEGFHQYTHFLFARSEAHRWFDEGHGDYYGAWKMKGNRLVPNEDMKGGLARLPEIKKMLKEGTAKPLSQHIRFNHEEWQNQGPSNVSCYAQSFSIIYFLREGTRGKVSSRYWKKEYADILPNYMFHLDAGYTEALAEMRKELEENLTDLREADADPEMIGVIENRLKRMHLNDDERQEVWNRAMAESWGLIDESEFEDRWKEYVLKEL